MKTVDNLNITSFSVRNKAEVMGSTKDYESRLGLRLPKRTNERLQEIADELNVNATEIIRQTVITLITCCEDIINENDY